MNREFKNCETPDTFVCDDYEEDEPKLCELVKIINTSISFFFL